MDGDSRRGQIAWQWFLLTLFLDSFFNSWPLFLTFFFLTFFLVLTRSIPLANPFVQKPWCNWQSHGTSLALHFLWDFELQILGNSEHLWTYLNQSEASKSRQRFGKRFDPEMMSKLELFKTICKRLGPNMVEQRAFGQFHKPHNLRNHKLNEPSTRALGFGIQCISIGLHWIAFAGYTSHASSDSLRKTLSPSRFSRNTT